MLRRIFGERFWTLEQVAKMLKISTSTLRKYHKEKRIYGIKVGKKWLFTKSDIKSFTYHATEPGKLKKKA